MALAHRQTRTRPPRRPDRLAGRGPGWGSSWRPSRRPPAAARGAPGRWPSGARGATPRSRRGRPRTRCDDDRQPDGALAHPQEDPAHRPQAPTSPLVLGPDGWKPPTVKPNPEAEAEFHEAERLFQQGKLAEAETRLRPARQEAQGDPLGREGPVLPGRGPVPARASTSPPTTASRTLIADYPGTEFLDKLVSREYAIAQTWLAADDPKAKPEQKPMPWYARFNGRRPLVDTQGHALQALEHVRHHDPTGPLADDAVLRIADQHMANQRLRDGRASTTTSSSPTTPRAPSCRRPSSPPSTPG